MSSSHGSEGAHGVKHHVTGEMYVFCDSFAPQLLDRCLGGTKQQVRHVIRSNAVDLFRHAPVETAQAGFYVCYRNVQLHRSERAGERRVGVSVNHNTVGPLAQKHFFDSLQHCAGLCAVAAGTNIQVEIWPRQRKLLKEYLCHLKVIVLAGVQKEMRDLRFSRTLLIEAVDRGTNHGCLYELWPHTDDGN